MKKSALLFVALVFGVCNAFAQAPNLLNYQAAARDGGGAILSNSALTVRFTVRQGSASGTNVYRETHAISTNSYGLFNAQVGGGTVVSGAFSTIAWGANGYWLQVEVNPGGGYVDLGAQQLVSVPYAKYAETAGNASAQTLSIAGSQLSISGGNSVTLPAGGVTYTAGTGISISGTTITNTGDTDPSNDITTTSVAGGDVTGTFSNLQIAAGVVGTAELAGSSVTSAKVANNAISTQHIVNGGVSGVDIDQMSAANGDVMTWNGVQWYPLPAASSGWGLSGNSGTGGSNYIGTADAQSLRFKVNNVQAGIIDNSGTTQLTSFGRGTFAALTSGGFNSAFGYGALSAATTGSYNTAIGGSSMITNSTGGYNTGLGYQSVFGNSTGSNNTGIGYSALRLNLSGDNNTALGYQTLFNAASPQSCVAIGAYALRENSGIKNTAVGSEALRNTTGTQNTAIGQLALTSNVAGNYNTAAGAESMIQNSSGTYNTAIGYQAGPNYGTQVNGTAIGRGAASTNDNQVRIGNTSVSSIGGYVNWTNASDARYKTNVQANVPGLAFIQKLEPVTYHLDVKAIDAKLGADPKTMDHHAVAIKEAIVYTGFLAQDVELAAKELGYDFSGVDAPMNEHSIYGLRYAEFVVPLVKAVQEQQVMIEQQMALIEQQQQAIVELKATVATIQTRNP